MTSPALVSPISSRVFEFPCNERTRMMLRIECIGRRLRGLIEMSSRPAHESAIMALFELYELFSSRSDVKNELLQELDRQRQRLLRYEGQPGVDQDRLREVSSNILESHASLNDVPLRLGSHIPEIEFLNTLKGRAGIPAGLCGFDLPALNVWLQRRDEARQEMLRSWIAPLVPLLKTTSLCLNLLRDSAEAMEHTAVGGQFETSTQGRSPRLVRVRCTDLRELVCDMSANKYMVAVRFRELQADLTLAPVEGDLAFELTLCEL